MASYRLTYVEPDISQSVIDSLLNFKLVPKNEKLTAPCKIELSSSDGDVFRLQRNTEFCLAETEEETQLVITGEFYGIIGPAWPKATMSCWSCRLHTSPPLQLLIRPSTEQEHTDDYFLAMGHMIVHDFDENGRHYVICHLNQGEKAHISYNPDIPIGKARYNARIGQMTDGDWDHIHQEYLDNRKWL